MDSFASWKMYDNGMKKEEREETSLQREDESRRSSSHKRSWIRVWRKKEMNEGRGRKENEILCSKEL